MISFADCANWVWLPKAETLRRRLRTARAMALLAKARLLVAWAPFRWWRGGLGWGGTASPIVDEAVSNGARLLAAEVERAAARSPFPTTCLPRAMALSWLLRRAAIPHAVILAARPREARVGTDDLHAWVEIGGMKLIGDLPGPWIELLHLGARSGTDRRPRR